MGREVGGRFRREGRIIPAPAAYSCWYMAETSTVLQSNYPPIKNKLHFKRIIKWNFQSLLKILLIPDYDSLPHLLRIYLSLLAFIFAYWKI